MKSAKSYKIILFIIAFVCAITSALMFVSPNVNTAYASASASNYITSDATTNLTNDNLVVTLKDGNTNFSFKNDVVVDDFGLEFVTPNSSNVTKIVLTVSVNSYIVTGNVKEGKLYTTIENVITLEYVVDNWKLSINDSEKVVVDLSNDSVKLQLSVENHLLKATIGDKTVVGLDDFYRVSTIDKTVATSFEVSITASEETEFSIKSVDQKVSDLNGAYKQTFNLTDENLTTVASPRVALNNAMFVMDENGNFNATALNGELNTITYSIYSFVGSIYSSNLSMKANETTEGNVVVNNDNKIVAFNKKSGDAKVFTLNIVKKGEEATVYETYDFNVVDKDSDEVAPKLINDEKALESFKLALEKKYIDGDHFIVLGNDITLPSFRSLVYDNITCYENLKYTIWYYGPNSETTGSSSGTTGSSSSITLNLGAAGDYTFFVVFKDGNGNAIEKDSFFVEEEDGSYTYGDNKDFVFTFGVNDDAPISVVATTDALAEGIVSTKYTAISFDVDASGFNTTYSLWYNEDVNATEESTGWVEIEAYADVSEDSYAGENYTYSELLAIAYDGELTFIPDKLGAYMIKCNVSSKVSTNRYEEAYEIIKVTKEKTVVDNDDSWISQNILPVVFLSIGVLCLIAILVLLFSKPKEKGEKVATNSVAKKSNK